jgi:hypothetical protein
LGAAQLLGRFRSEADINIGEGHKTGFMSTRPSGGLLFRFHLPSFALSASDWGDFMRKSTDCILMLRPWSWSTFMATLLAVAFATTMQKLFAEFGARLCSLAYFPRS